jgi:peptidoglycan/xylan/chitin deacetylase (PgdA/CDA1 family)
MYHEIASEPLTSRHLAVRPDVFAEQLSYLRDGGYTTLTVAELMHGMAGSAARRPARPVVLTFDDGYADFYDVALPMLRSYGFTATVFVTTGWVDGAGDHAVRAPSGMMSWGQIGDAAAAGIEIGAHSHRHAQLDQLAADTLRHELGDSKAFLEDQLGWPVTGLAYPFGYFSPQVRSAAFAAGYRYACAVGNRYMGPGADHFALPRLTIGRHTGMRSFSRVARGDRLPAQFLARRTVTLGWSVVRKAKSTGRRIAG